VPAGTHEAAPTEPPAGDAQNRRKAQPFRDSGYDDLRADEVVALRPSLDAEALRALHAHEIANRRRRTVIRAIERLQRWEAQP
jgi:hypothetical protein